jgi:carbon storage regulator
MLVLTRRRGESIMIGGQIEIQVLSVSGDSVRFGVIAPKEVEVFRKELYLSIQETNRMAQVNVDQVNRFVRLLDHNRNDD